MSDKRFLGVELHELSTRSASISCTMMLPRNLIASLAGQRMAEHDTAAIPPTSENGRDERHC